ncbi:MAG: ABC transporter permease [Candidatus Eiseniibacteriota bacterium]|jgi:ABC-type lipoprotein release transport system permease subunit
MLFYLRLAWRNLLRNKRRTFIAGTAIGIGLAALVFVDALMLGMNRHMIRSATASFMGEGQVHRDGYRQKREIEETIVDPDSVVARLEASPIVDAYARRAYAFAMIHSPASAQGVSMVGIEPDHERLLSQIDDVLVEGEYLGGGRREIVIGSKLAELLEVGIGDRVVVTTAEAHTGNLAQELFRVTGIYRFNVRELDRTMAFVGLGKAQQMLGLDGAIHEIAIRFTDPRYGRDENLPLWKELSAGPNEALGWTRLMPQLSAALDLSGFSLLIVGIILFGVVSLGIINTLFMSLYERMFEFGVLRAVGTRPRTLAQLVVGEAAALALISIVLGLGIAAVCLAIFAHVGIDYTGIEYAGVTFRDKIFPVPQVVQFVKYPAVVLLLTVVVGLYPAIYAARLEPARAMRRSF